MIGVMSQTGRVIPFRVASAGPLVSFTNSAAISIPASGAAGLYPSPIVVSGQSGVVTAVTVRLNGFSHTSPGDVDVLLVSPDGRKFKVVSDAGSNTGAPTGQATVNVNATFSDAGAAVLPTGDTKWGADNSTFTARPTDYVAADTFPAPAPAAPYGTPATTGTDTLNGFFNGSTPNGTWNLYVADDTSGDSGNISGGWTLDITTAAGSAATTTTVTSSANPSLSPLPVTFTANVTSSSTVNNGTVTFQSGGTDLTCSEGAQPRPVGASGQAACTLAIVAAGNRLVTATYNPGAGFLGSSGSVLQQTTLRTPPNHSNPGAISIENPASPNPQQSDPYPGKILVGGLGGTTVSNLTVTLNGLTHADTTDLDVLLVGPTGAAFVLMSDAGNTAAVSNISLTLSDAAASPLPTGSALSSGTFRPTNYGAGDTFPNTNLGTVTASGLNTAAPAGSGTLLSAFGGTDPNGVWSLYIIDDAASGTGTLAGGWTLNIATGGGTSTTTVVSSSNNPSFTTPPNNQTTFNATVMSGALPVTAGNVNFKENGIDLICNEGAQPRSLNASGQATCTTSFSTEGQHLVTAFYNGNASFGVSNGSVTQTVTNQPTGVPPQFCNATALTVSDNGPGNPYPKLIVVSGLSGQATKVTATVNGLTHPGVGDVDLLLVGPGGQRVLLMSDTGGTSQAVSNVNLTFDDAAAGSLPAAGAIATGTYKPTDVNTGTDSFPAPAPGGATATTMAAFLPSAPNGTWAFYVVDDTSGDSGAASGGVCLNFTMGSAATTAAVTSSQNPAFNGQSVTFTATVNVTAPGVGTPTGNVQFRDGAANLGAPVSLNASGQAQFATSTLTPGSHNITAVYNPTGNFTTSTSPTLVQQVSVLTAAGVEISGRVLTPQGRGIGRAIVTLTDAEGRVVSVQTPRGGHFRFTDVPAGATYTIAVSQGRFRFTPNVIQVSDSIVDMNIIAEP